MIEFNVGLGKGVKGKRKYGDLSPSFSFTGLGEGFLVKVDGITIFHGGDHESSDQSWNKFTKEIDYLNELKQDIKKFDLIFLQMMFEEQIDSSRGVFYALEKL